jgi:flagellar hook-basal body complex protein FliE
MSDPIGAILQQVGGGVEFPLAPPQGRLTGIGDGAAREVPVLRPAGGGESSFADTLTRTLNAVSADQTRASDAIASYLRGDPVELHSVVAAAEEAQLSLQLLVQVRNKFIEAYRTLSSMHG